VRVNAPPETNKEKIHSDMIQHYKVLETKYEAELLVQKNQIRDYKEQNANLWLMANSLAQRSIYNVIEVSTENKAMINSKDNSQNLNNVNITANNSVVNLGEIRGTVNNSIQTLAKSSQPNATELSDRLQQLQTAIESAPELNDDKKVEALEEVSILAQAGQNPQDTKLKKEANKALLFLQSIIAALTPTAAIAKACADLLPAIAKLLGIG
jgi:hypothetical protein